MGEPSIASTGGESGTDGVAELSAEIAVAEVTLLEDRAVVRRRGRLMLPPGRSRVHIGSVAPVLVDKTLAGELTTPDGEPVPDGVDVRDVRLVRKWITQDADRPADVAELAAEIRDKARDKDALVHRLQVIDAQVEALSALAAQSIDELNVDVGWGRGDLQAASAELEDLDGRIAALGQERCEVEERRRLAQRDLDDLRRLEAGTANLDAVASAALIAELVNGTDAPIDVRLQIDYLVPGAMWRPWHTARLVEDADGARVSLRTDGCVWQATGENWNDVQVRFSTERPSLGVSPPTLQTDELAIRKRASTVEVQARDQKIHAAGLDGESATAAVDDELPGIDDGGDALELKGRARASIPGDGRPHRIPIDEFETSADAQWVCTPELALAVMLRSRQVNAGRGPLLAGPVDLVRNGGLVGRTSVLFVAPGERFELGWGPDSTLRVTRDVEHLPHERKTLSSWTRKPRKVTVKLSNLAPDPRPLKVKERIAVSEVDKVEVELVEASHGAKADDDGFVTWDARVRGFGHDELELSWTLVVHDDVVGL